MLKHWTYIARSLGQTKTGGTLLRVSVLSDAHLYHPQGGSEAQENAEQNEAFASVSELYIKDERREKQGLAKAETSYREMARFESRIPWKRNRTQRVPSNIQERIREE